MYVQNQLNILQNGSDRKIAFWYDYDEIDQLQISGNNHFVTKLLLEHQDFTTD